MPDDFTLKWIFRQLMGEGISNTIAPPVVPPTGPRIGPVEKKFSLEDPTALLRDKIHELQGTDRFLPTDLLSLISQPTGPEGAMPAGGIIPAAYRRKLAEQLAESTYNILKDQGMHLSASLVPDMLTSKAHAPLASHLTEVSGMASPRFSGLYRGGSYDWMKKAINREPLTTQMSPAAKYLQAIQNLSDEELANYARTFGGSIHINPNLEERGAAEIYKTMRHELSHAADDLLGKKVGSKMFGSGDDPRYWVSLQEVRARAAEPNYIREMTGKADPRTIIDVEGDPFLAPKLRHRRARYSEKISDEILRGKRIADEKLKEGIPSSAFGAFQGTEPELKNTLQHYFASPGKKQFIESYHPIRIREERIPARLEPTKQLVPLAQLIKDNPAIIESNLPRSRKRGIVSPSERALEDLMARLRGY